MDLRCQVIDATNDIALFQKIRENNRPALNTLFTTYYTSLCGFAFSYLKNQEEAEECVADVFYNLWKNRHQIQVDRSLKAYLYISVKHAAFAHLRGKKIVFNEIDEVIESIATDSVTPDHALDYQELEQKVSRAIDTLPERCRAIFMMSRYDGLKYKEIGEILHISEKTVENQLVKALTILRRHLLADRQHSYPVST